jgi:asparagine synthase (glutamine-hydrolysing)
MVTDDGRYAITYNGEVFNHSDIRRDLEASGERFHTRCDTEVVLRLFGRRRADCVTSLRGMFAFAIWDRDQRELFLARDRLGVKPLYYVHRDDGALFFASEMKALLSIGAVVPALNEQAIPDYLANHAPSGDETLFTGIRRLPAGHTLAWRDGRIRLERYWDLTFEENALSAVPEAELINEYLERLRESVRLRLMSDVPLGSFLSGGIDSAAITALMSSLMAEPVKTFSVAFAEREANELHYARIVSQRFNTEHHEVVLSKERFFDTLPELVWNEDEPLAHPSSVALNIVSRLAAEHVKVVLTGEGSDETLAGYPWHRATVVNMSLARAMRLLPSRAVDAMRLMVGALPPGGPVGRRLRRTALYLPGNLNGLLFDNFGVFSRQQQLRLLTPEFLSRLGAIQPFAAQHAKLARVAGSPLLNQLLYVDIKIYLQELLMKQDQMSMAASIESRVPFLDHTLVEFTARLPLALKLRGLTSKYVLRRAMEGILPPDILTRKKMGFPVPTGRWFRTTHSALLENLLLGDRAGARGLFRSDIIRTLLGEHRSGAANHAERIWALLNLEIWQRIFIDGEAKEDVVIALRPEKAVA